jgi:putative ABC transport system permease protein
VTQRTQEIGIRMALGAKSADVLQLVARRGLRLTLTGMGVGLALSLALGQLVRSFLFGLSPADPLTLLGVVLLLGAVALMASWIPARRATRIDPMRALRAE